MTLRAALRSLVLEDGLRSRAAAFAAVWIIVAAGGVLGYELVIPKSGIATLWPPAGIVLGILLTAPTRRWPEIAGAAGLGCMTADMLWGASGWIIPGAALANVTENLCAAAVVRTLIQERVHLGSLRQLALLFLGGVVASNAFTALGGALVIGKGETANYGRHWLIWFIGDGLGMLTLAPLVVRLRCWVSAGARITRSTVEAAALSVTLVPIAIAVLHFSDSGARWVPVYVLFPFLVWTGIRHGILAASFASAVLAVTLLVTLVHTPTLFTGPAGPRLQQEIEVYLFILVSTVSALTPAALIEERQALDQRLRASERRFADLANTIHEAFFVLRVDDRTVTYANASAMTLLAAAPGARLDLETWLTRVHPDDWVMAREQISVLSRGQVADITLRLPGHDTEWRWLHVRAYPVAADDGARQVSCVASDVTALRHAEERLRHAEKLEAVGQFASGIAHDFSNVLTVTLMAADTLENVIPVDSLARSEVAAIRGASDRAAQLARQLLRFSRREPASRRLVPLHVVLHETMPLLSRLVGAGVQCTMHLDADADTVFADPSDLEQVLFNLCKNASDAMPGGGRLTIATRRSTLVTGEPPAVASRDAIALVVQDSGTGINATTIARIFEPYFTTKAKGRGTGLGLATVQRIVQQHEGRIDVTSAPQQGTTFVVTLPLVPSEGAAIALN